MKKTLIVLLAVLMVATMAIGLAACQNCSKDGHKWDNGVEVTAATCTDKAVYKYTCSVCKETENRPVGNPLGHDYETGWTYTDDTGHYHVCKNDSTHKTEKVAHVYDQDGNTKCICGASKPVEACTHPNMTHEEAKAATCASTGNVEYWHCATCNKYFNSQAATTELDYDTEVVIAINPDAHDYDMESWDYTDGTGHYHVCNNFAGHHTDTVEHTLVYTNNEGDTHDEACSACEYSATGVTHVYDQADNKCACGAENPDVEPGCSCPDCECGSCDDCDNCSCPNCGNGGGGDEPCEHPGIAKTEAKAATCSSIGYKVDFWYCEDCGNYYDSEEAINELDYDDDILIAINDQAHNYGEEWYYDGADGHYHKCSYNEAHTSTPVAHAVNSYVDNSNGTHKEVCVCEYAINDSVDHTLNYTNKTDDTHDEACEHCDYSATNVTHVYNQDSDTKCLCGQEKPADVITYTHVAGTNTHTVYTNGIAGEAVACTFDGDEDYTCDLCEYVYVEDVAFGQDSYTIVTSGSNGQWTSTTIVASVTNSATDSGVTYTINHESLTYSNGTFTATQMGTFKVTATTVGVNKDGETITTDEITVIVYTSAMYMTGKINGVENWGTSNSDWALTWDSSTRKYTSASLLIYTNDGFQIVYTGMKLGSNGSWDGAIKNDGGTFAPSESAYYEVIVDISGTEISVMFNKTGDYTPPADWTVTKTIKIDFINYNGLEDKTGANWSGNVYAQTVSVDANNPTATITYDFSASVFEKATEQVEIGFNDGSTWYGNSTSLIEYTENDCLSHTWKSNKWYNWNEGGTKRNDSIKYVGAVYGLTFNFAITFNSTGAITNITITAA